MARTRSEWEFVNIKLSAEDKPKLVKFAKELDNNLINAVSELAARQYKVSISWVDKQNSFVVSVSGSKEGSKNNGTTMTSWSDDLEEAIFMSAYKVLEVTQDGIWADYAQEDSNWG